MVYHCCVEHIKDFSEILALEVEKVIVLIGCIF